MKKILKVFVAVAIISTQFNCVSYAQSLAPTNCNLTTERIKIDLAKTHVIKISDTGIMTLFGTAPDNQLISCTCDLKVDNGGPGKGIYIKVVNKVLTIEKNKAIAGNLAQSKIVINEKPTTDAPEVWIAGFEKYAGGNNLKFIGIEDVRGIQHIDSDQFEPTGSSYNFGISKAVGSNFWFVSPNQFWNETTSSVPQERKYTPGYIYSTPKDAKDAIDKTFY